MKPTTVRVQIAAEHIKEAAALAEAGMPPNQVLIFSDTKTTGLQLRVQGKKAAWAVKYYDWTKYIGFAYPTDDRHIPSVSVAREVTAAAKEVLLDNDKMLEPFLVKYHAVKDVKKARKEMQAAVTTWTLRECFEFVVKDRTRPGTQRPIGGNYKAELELTLRRKSMQKVLDIPVAKLDRGDFDDIRRDVQREAAKVGRDEDPGKKGLSAVNKVISNVRSVLSYCLEWESKAAGLSHRDMWWMVMSGGGKVDARDRQPSLADMAKTLKLGNEYRLKKLPGRTGVQFGVRPNVLASLFWLCLTAQRTFAALHIKKDNFFPDEQSNDGWYIAYWEKGVMKAGKEHYLPIPPRAVALMLPLLDMIEEEGNSTVWMFPSERGSDDNDITVNRSAVRQFLQRLAARDVLVKEKDGGLREGAVDLFKLHGIPWWTPHDIRRSITDVMDDEGIPGGASAVLAHEIKLTDKINEETMTDAQREEWNKVKVAKITKAAYGNPKFMALKRKSMETWCDAVIDAYEEVTGIGEARRTVQRNQLVKRFLREYTEDTIRNKSYRVGTIPAKIDRLEREIAGIQRKIDHAEGVDVLNFTSIKLKRFQQNALRAGNCSEFLMNEDRKDYKKAIAQYRNEIPDFDPVLLAPEYDAIRVDYLYGDLSDGQFIAAVTRTWGIEFRPEDN